ncbi:acyl-CoA synthetase [Curvibacter sp. PAE-UM]|uniref:acyl-CoA synthetase n=1 Tax=Curvibacter sp. PAE-UM TaxID=1714344 RepID=UPI000710482B|nr:AMP-binding protein [Curvibacter sp. PAE-UM]KRH99853.1 AMP-binding protein [Curvibacter sp. PAE-UM]
MASSQDRDNYASLHGEFRWLVPDEFNIAEVCSRRWARAADAGQRIAIHADGPGLQPRAHSYAELQHQANRLSNALAQLRVRQGDRVAIVLPQRFETAVAYMAVLQLGAVAMPLSTLFGPEALEFRLNDSAASVLICDDAAIVNIQNIRGECEALRHVIGVGSSAGGDAGGGAAGMADLDYAALLAQHPPEFDPVRTRADDPAVLIYTSGTTGNPKGALIPHRALIGNLTGFVCSQNWFGFDPQDRGPLTKLPQPKTPSVFWSPADWSWTGGLMDALLPSLYFGRPIVAWNGRFSPQAAFELLQKYEITHTFLFPTALKAMMKAFPQPKKFFKLRLRAIMSAGEAVGDAVFGYCQKELGVTVNEMFGQTEVNYIVGNCSIFYPAKPGSMGKGYPGHRVAVIDEQGRECASGTLGEVAIHRLDVHGDPDPIFFLGYWKNEADTRDKYTGDWCRTGDLALRDPDGYLWYQGRADDMFKAAGYRIGPGEIENCLIKHPAVANAAVVPKPDAERGALVKAYVVLTVEAAAERGDEPVSRNEWERRLMIDLQRHVKGQLAPYEYPKEIEFLDALPMTTTGKVQRRVLRLLEEERARQAGTLPTA